MSRTPKWERLWLIPLICVIASSAFADTNDSPCNGMLAIVNRPTIADSPCTAPNKKFILEFGYEYLNLLEGIQGQSYPFAELRYGLPANNEIFVFFLPISICQQGRVQDLVRWRWVINMSFFIPAA